MCVRCLLHDRGQRYAIARGAVLGRFPAVSLRAARGAAVAAIVVAEFLGTFGLSYVQEERVLRWYVRRARSSRARAAPVISATHVAMVVFGLVLIALASAFPTHASSVAALLLAVPYGAVSVATMPAEQPNSMGTAGTARKLGARRLAGTIGLVGGAWSFVALGLWFAAVLGGLTGLGLIE